MTAAAVGYCFTVLIHPHHARYVAAAVDQRSVGAVEVRAEAEAVLRRGQAASCGAVLGPSGNWRPCVTGTIPDREHYSTRKIPAVVIRYLRNRHYVVDPAMGSPLSELEVVPSRDL
jgi:hypothetical protein